MTGDLEDMVADYLRVRRALGYKLEDNEHILVAFVAYLRSQDAQGVSVEHALDFATAATGASPRRQALRLSAIRCFARWAMTIDPTVQVPPASLLPARATRAAPYIYTEDEVGALIGAADRLSPAIRAATFHTLIALMASTGLRTGEVLGLDITNLDQCAATLTVTGKYGKIRMLPLHPTVLHGLTRYLHQRERLLPAPNCPALLISTRGHRLLPSTVHYTFRGVVRQAGLGAVSSACRPRLHDLRHSFAVATMLDAYRSGADPAATLPVLSTWLGHARPGDTYWYLTGTAELMAAAIARLERSNNDGQGQPS
jgi:integrase